MHWIRHTTLTWVERTFGFAVAQAYAGHEDHGRGGRAMATYVRAGLGNRRDFRRGGDRKTAGRSRRPALSAAGPGARGKMGWAVMAASSQGEAKAARRPADGRAACSSGVCLREIGCPRGGLEHGTTRNFPGSGSSCGQRYTSQICLVTAAGIVAASEFSMIKFYAGCLQYAPMCSSVFPSALRPPRRLRCLSWGLFWAWVSNPPSPFVGMVSGAQGTAANEGTQPCPPLPPPPRSLSSTRRPD
jgi:hypothetical protein